MCSFHVNIWYIIHKGLSKTITISSVTLNSFVAKKRPDDSIKIVRILADIEQPRSLASAARYLPLSLRLHRLA